jgi:drug/metabolite transporter (DMT)-like permease
MSDQNYIILGLFLGLISTLFVHLGKAMERHGIEIFKFKEKSYEKKKKSKIYIIGFIFNQSVVLWQFIALQFASAAVFSSVFGIGLILLMLYSHYILHEEISYYEVLGTILIIMGTTLLGFNLLYEESNEGIMNYGLLYLMLIISVLILISLLTISVKFKIGIAIIFGLVAGVLSGLDNILKRVGLESGIMNIGDLNTLPFFILSFLFAWSAFLICQYGFAKGAEASRLVPMYNSLYISFPVFFEMIFFGLYSLSLGKIVFLTILMAGVFFLFINKESNKVRDL